MNSIRRRNKILFLALCFNSCLYFSALGMESTAIDVDVKEIVRNAARGSRIELYDLGRKGGDGAWFVLAEVADFYDHDTLARELREKSYINDSDPFKVISLTKLLIEHPHDLRLPLHALRKTEKRLGTRDDIRHARISVLAAQGKERALSREMAQFSGKAWEVPILTALIHRREVDSKTADRIERFILNCENPEVLRNLPSAVEDYIDDGINNLLQARKSISVRNYMAALIYFDRWLMSLESNSELRDLAYSEKDIVSPVFAEIVQAAIEDNQITFWAFRLAEVSVKLTHSGKYGSSYAAGRLFRYIKRYDKAAAAFSLASSSLAKGLDTDRALWQHLVCLHLDGSVGLLEEIEAFIWAAASWTDPARFVNRLELFIHRRVNHGEWLDLKSLYQNSSIKWPAIARAQAALVLAFAAYEGYLPETSPENYLEDALEAAPLSWWGLRAAGLLGREVIISPSSGIANDGEHDAVAQLLLRWGLDNVVLDSVLDNSSSYSDKTIRMLSRSFASEFPRTSIRIIGLLNSRMGYSPGLEDLFLQYPLSYEEPARRAAVDMALPPEIYFGLIRTESAWDSNAISRSGAQGLTQFMPATWEEWIERLKYPADSDPMDPELNLTLGAAYLNWLRGREWTSGWVDALVSYNAGGGRLRRWRNSQPNMGEDLFGLSIPLAEPRKYTSKVFLAATLYGFLYEGKLPRELHTSWNLTMMLE